VIFFFFGKFTNYCSLLIFNFILSFFFFFPLVLLVLGSNTFIFLKKIREIERINAINVSSILPSLLSMNFCSVRKASPLYVALRMRNSVSLLSDEDRDQGEYIKCCL